MAARRTNLAYWSKKKKSLITPVAPAKGLNGLRKQCTFSNSFRWNITKMYRLLCHFVNIIFYIINIAPQLKCQRRDVSFLAEGQYNGRSLLAVLIADGTIKWSKYRTTGGFDEKVIPCLFVFDFLRNINFLRCGI